MTTALLLLAALHAPFVFAADRLDPITVEASDPGVVSDTQLEKKQAADLEDALRDQADVLVGGAQRAAQKVYVRGLEDTQLNVTVDGARQTGYLFHHQGRLNIDVELMKRIQVGAGTGDALAGPGALGGTLRFETKDADDLLAPGRTVGAFLKAKYHTAADERGWSVGLFGKASQRVGLLAYLNGSEAHDYAAGGEAGRVAYTGAKPLGALVKATWRPSEAQKLSLSAVKRNDNARRLLRAHFGAIAGNAPNDQSFETQTYTANYQYAPGKPLVNLTAQAYYSGTELEQRRPTSSSNAKGSSLGTTVANVFELSALTVTTGADFNQEKVRGTGAVRSNTERGDIYGLFAQGRYQISSRWWVASGARFDHYVLTDVAANPTRNQRLSPNARTRYELGRGFGLNAAWSEAFRGATPVEGFVMASATGVAANPGAIRGTVASTTEAGIDYKQSHFSSQLTGYVTKVRRPIDSSVNAAGLVERKNADDIRSRGLTASARATVDNLRGQLGYSHNVVKYGSQPLGYTAFNRGNSYGDRFTAGLEYNLPRLRLGFAWDSLFALKLKRVPTGREPQPGYNTHDFSVFWLPVSDVRLAASVNNAFDKLYVAQGTPYVLGAGGVVNALYEPGRDFRFSASVSF